MCTPQQHCIIQAGPACQPLAVCVRVQVDFFILQRGRVDDGLFAYERNTPKDMLFLGPGEELWVITRYVSHGCQQLCGLASAIASVTELAAK